MGDGLVAGQQSVAMYSILKSLPLASCLVAVLMGQR